MGLLARARLLLPTLLAAMVLPAHALARAGAAPATVASAPAVTKARAAFEAGRFAQAEKLLAPALASQGEARLEALALEAEILAAQGNVADAIRRLDPSKDAPGDGGRRVRLELGSLLIRAGRRADAEPVLLQFATEYNNDAIGSNDAAGLAMLGRAMHLLRHPKDANTAFKESFEADQNRVQTLLWWAELFAEYDRPDDAEAALKDALKIAPHSAQAKVALARLRIEQSLDFDASEKLASEALAEDPKAKGAYAVRAGIALRDMNLDAANAAIDAGLAVDPNDLELLSLRAAARFLGDDRPGFEAAKRAVFARNKEFARAYSIIGEYAEWEHRYDDVVAMMKKAVALDPNDGKAWAELGLWQTRAGDEQTGVQSLEEWWKHDHFDVRAFNTLQNLYTDWIPKDYDSEARGVFDLRYPKPEHAVLARYVPRMLGEAWGRMKVHYLFTPAAPVHVEMYESREHFSVRTSGLPDIDIQGVCFGHVVAAMSPAGEPFNWGNVLWHELAHVFAIQLSKSHVPRWFTEGLSEYETMLARPEWQRELDPQLYSALVHHALPGALDMNRAFTHTQEHIDVAVAYYAASQMLAYTAERYGFRGITKALRLWGEGKRTPDVIVGAFGVTPPEYDAGFRAWEMARLSRYEHQYVFDLEARPLEQARAAAAASPPGSAAAHVVLAFAEMDADDPRAAASEIATALKLDPNDKDAHFLAAKLAASNQDVDGQRRHLEAIQAAGGDGYTIEMTLAGLAQARHDPNAQRRALEAAHRLDPTQVDADRALFELATAQGRQADALSALREVARLDQHDRRAWGMLLDKLVSAGRWDEAKRTGEAALYVDVESAAIHVDYARALAATGDHRQAAFELESALLCQAAPKELATAHALLAREDLALGDAAGARTHRDKALELDPTNADARSLRL